MIMQPHELLNALYASEINCRIESFFDDGWIGWLGDATNGFKFARVRSTPSQNASENSPLKPAPSIPTATSPRSSVAASERSPLRATPISFRMIPSFGYTVPSRRPQCIDWNYSRSRAVSRA